MVVNSSHLVVTKKIQNCHFMSKFGTTANSNMQKTLFFLFEQNNFFFQGGGGGWVIGHVQRLFFRLEKLNSIHLKLFFELKTWRLGLDI